MGKALIRLWAGHHPTNGRNILKQGQDGARRGSQQSQKAPSALSHLPWTLWPGRDMGDLVAPTPRVVPG